MRWSIRHLNYVVVAAEQGSIVNTAAHLGVSQAAIGAAITNLEEAFGVRIFNRQPGRGLTLTPSGQELMGRARKLIQNAEAFEAYAAQLSQSLSGPVNVACFFPAAPFVMPSLIADISRRYPAVTVSLFEGDIYEVFQRLSDGSSDIGLTYDLMPNPRVVFEPLLAVPLYVLLPAASPLAQAEDVSLFDIVRLPYIMLDLPGTRDWFMSVFRRYRLEPDIRFRTRSTDMVRSLVARDQGFSLLGFRSHEGSFHDGVELCYLPVREPLPVAQFGLAFSTQSRKTRVVETFAKIARKRLRDSKLQGTTVIGNDAKAARSGQRAAVDDRTR